MNYYYIGLNANNAIENDHFFKGSITIYPTLEKGNIFFSNQYLEDTYSIQFMDCYKKFVEDTVSNILKKEQAIFFCFNQKVKKMCQEIGNIPMAESNEEDFLANINNKFKIREKYKKEIPILRYEYIKEGITDYSYLCKLMDADKMVLQEKTGAGGETTFFVDSEDSLRRVSNPQSEYCISNYQENIPLNVTTIIGANEILYLAKSIQLIKIMNQKFKYVGGDFRYIEYLQDSILKKVDEYSQIICLSLQQEGYRGVLGIDFIITTNGKVFFMELNPRFQSSSFMINLYLKQYWNCDIAELNYDALRENKLKDIQFNQNEIKYSFLNCNSEISFDHIEDFYVLNKGYSEKNQNSIYRKIYKRTILYEDSFEKIPRR